MTVGPPEAADRPPGQAAPASGFAAPPQDGGPTPDDGPAAEHTAPDGVSQATVDAVGKLTAALELARAARARGLGLMTGCMVSSSLSIAPALHVAILSDFVDLDGPTWLRDDRPGGVGTEDGFIHPAAAGFWGTSAT